MKKYILILFSIISFWSCTEDESIDITVLPSATTTGANTFGCLMDGWIYVGGRYLNWDTRMSGRMIHSTTIRRTDETIRSMFPSNLYTQHTLHHFIPPGKAKKQLSPIYGSEEKNWKTEQPL